MSDTEPVLSYQTPATAAAEDSLNGGSSGGSSDRNAAVLAGFLGWTLDAFDYFIVTMSSKHIAETFGVDRSAITWTMVLTLMMRPIGALIFGLLADRYGRRRPMMINLVFYSTMSVLSGFSKSYWTFLICRILFGIGMGGEWGVGASLAMEKVPPRLRGLLSGLLQEGYAVGGLLASGMYFLVYPRFGWQPLFWIGGLPALLALFLRFFVKESAVWQKTKQSNWGNLGTALLSHWKTFLILVALMLMMNLSSHGTQDLFPAALRDRFGVKAEGKVAGINAFSQLGMILGGLTVGFLSDRIGRRWAMIGSFILATALVPLWAYAPNLALLAVLLAETRGIWIATAVGGLYLLWFWNRKFVFLLPAGVLVIILVSPFIRERVESMVKPRGVDSNAFRLVAWRTGIHMIESHPWLGLGPEEVNKQFMDWVPPDVPRPLPEGWYGHLHNIYLQYAAERGIPTMLVMMWILGQILVDFWRGLRSLPPGRSDRRFLLHGGIAVVLATLAEGFVEYNLGISPVLTMFLVVVACGYLALDEPDTKPAVT